MSFSNLPSQIDQFFKLILNLVHKDHFKYGTYLSFNIVRRWITTRTIRIELFGNAQTNR